MPSRLFHTISLSPFSIVFFKSAAVTVATPSVNVSGAVSTLSSVLSALYFACSNTPLATFLSSSVTVTVPPAYAMACFAGASVAPVEGVSVASVEGASVASVDGASVAADAGVNLAALKRPFVPVAVM